MSCNIIDIGQNECSLELSLDLFKKYEKNDDLPEGCFLTDNDYFETQNQTVKIKELYWHGVWSGNSMDLFEEILEKTTGSFEGRIVWEDGNIETLKVKDGKVTRETLGYE